MKAQKTVRSPLALKIVAFLFLLIAIQSVLNTVVAYIQGTTRFDPGILYFFLYSGLLAHRSYARTIALFFIGLGLITSPIVMIILIVDIIHVVFNPVPVQLLEEFDISNTIPFHFFWWSYDIAEVYALPIILLMVLLMIALLVWMRKVLLRPGIKALFVKNPKTNEN